MLRRQEVVLWRSGQEVGLEGVMRVAVGGRGRRNRELKDLVGLDSGFISGGHASRRGCGIPVKPFIEIAACRVNVKLRFHGR